MRHRSRRRWRLLGPSCLEGGSYCPKGFSCEPPLYQTHERSACPGQRVRCPREGEHLVPYRVVFHLPLDREALLSPLHVPWQGAEGEPVAPQRPIILLEGVGDAAGVERPHPEVAAEDAHYRALRDGSAGPKELGPPQPVHLPAPQGLASPGEGFLPRPQRRPRRWLVG